MLQLYSPPSLPSPINNPIGQTQPDTRQQERPFTPPMPVSLPGQRAGAEGGGWSWRNKKQHKTSQLTSHPVFMCSYILSTLVTYSFCILLPPSLYTCCSWCLGSSHSFAPDQVLLMFQNHRSVHGLGVLRHFSTNVLLLAANPSSLDME